MLKAVRPPLSNERRENFIGTWGEERCRFDAWEFLDAAAAISETRFPSRRDDKRRGRSCDLDPAHDSRSDIFRPVP